MAWQGFGKRQAPNSKAAREVALKSVNVDSSDLDSDMKETLSAEAARRVGAYGVQLGRPGPGEGGRVPGVKYVPKPREAFKSAAKWLGGLGKPKPKK